MIHINYPSETHQVVGHDVEIGDMLLQRLDIEMLQIPETVGQCEGDLPTRVFPVERLSDVRNKQVEVFRVVRAASTVARRWVFPIDIDTTKKQDSQYPNVQLLLKGIG